MSALMQPARPLDAKRPSGPDLLRTAADLDHIRALGNLAPDRLESLRLAARELRRQAEIDAACAEFFADLREKGERYRIAAEAAVAEFERTAEATLARFRQVRRR